MDKSGLMDVAIKRANELAESFNNISDKAWLDRHNTINPTTADAERKNMLMAIINSESRLVIHVLIEELTGHTFSSKEFIEYIDENLNMDQLRRVMMMCIIETFAAEGA